MELDPIEKIPILVDWKTVLDHISHFPYLDSNIFNIIIKSDYFFFSLP